MVNSHVSDRFTAQEALTFLDDAQLEMTNDQLNERPSIRSQCIPFDEFDRWSNIPPTLLEKWGRYRERPPSYIAKYIIYRLCLRPWGISLVYHTRQVFRHAFFVCKLPFRLVSYIFCLL